MHPKTVEARYPALAPLAQRVRQELGELTPVKRWLAGRLFVGIRIWLHEFDHGDIKQPRPAIDPYPALTQDQAAMYPSAQEQLQARQQGRGWGSPVRST